MHVNDIRLLSCSFKQNRKYEGQGEVEMEADIKFGANFDEKSSIVTASIIASISENKDYPYCFEIEMGGKFYLEENEIPHLERICKINIPAILFPYLREDVADVTRRSGNQPMHLSTINFVEVAKQGKTECAE